MGIVNETKEIVGLIQKVSQLELRTDLQEKIATLQGHVFELQEKLLALQEENASLKSKDNLEEKIQQLKAELPYQNGAYRKPGTGIAYCSGCLEHKGELITLSQMRRNGCCPVCTRTYRDVFGL